MKTPDFIKEIRGLSGGRSRTRTYDPLIKRQLFHIVERVELNHFR